MSLLVWGYSRVPSRDSDDCLFWDCAETLAASEACPAAFIADARTRSATQPRSSFDGSCCLRNLEPPLNDHFPSPKRQAVTRRNSSEQFVPAHFNRGGPPKDAAVDFHSSP